MHIATNMKSFFQWHLETARQAYAVLPAWLLLLPFLLMPLLYALDQTWLSAYLTKDYSEVTALVVLSAALPLAIWPLFNNPQTYYKWQFLLGLALFFREWHFYGTNNGFYLAFVLLVWWASRYRDRLQPFFRQRWMVGLFATAVWSYLISKTFDRHYWDDLMPAGVASDLIEENLEVFGHLLFLGLVITSLRLREKVFVNS